MEPSRWRAAIGNLVDALLIRGNLGLREVGIAPWPFVRGGPVDGLCMLVLGISRGLQCLGWLDFAIVVLDEQSLQCSCHPPHGWIVRLQAEVGKNLSEMGSGT